MFWRWLLQLGAVVFLPVTITGIFSAIVPDIFPEYARFDGLGEWIYALVGPALYAWLLWEVFRPRLKTERWRGRVGWTGPPFSFCSTHPSYIFIDLLTLAFVGFIIWMSWEAGFDKKVIWIMLAVALSFPVLRLFAWYGLGLKIDDAATYDAHEAPLWAFGIVTGVVGLGALVALFS